MGDMMDAVPVTELEELEKHLDDLTEKPDTPIDAELFDRVELQLTEANIPNIMPRLLPKLASILKVYQLDPLVLCSLALKLLQATSFTQIFTITSEADIVEALRSPAASANTLAMAILGKASASPSEVSILAASALLVTEFLKCWLSAPQVEVGERGVHALTDLLETDCELPPVTLPLASGLPRTDLMRRRVPGHGSLWRRLFMDRDMFGLLVDLCEGTPFDGDVKQRSLAQGRILRVIPRLAVIHFSALTRSYHPDLLPRPNARAAGASPDSFLHYVTVRMVDLDDYLMRLSLVDYIETLVCAGRIAQHSPYTEEVLRGLLRELTALDPTLTRTLESLPERVAEDEAEKMKGWINKLIPQPPNVVVE
ncbi:hypothetical protein RB597_007022 [Gaeumannomyces tritici]